MHCERLTVIQLKEELRKNNLKVSGKKKDLVERLAPVYEIPSLKIKRVNNRLESSQNTNRVNNNLFLMSDEKFKNEVINHFKHRLQRVVSSQDFYLAVHFSTNETDEFDYANWRKRVCDEITTGKKIDSTELYKKIDDILMKIATSARDALAATDTISNSWWIRILDNNLGFVVYSPGAEFILTR